MGYNTKLGVPDILAPVTGKGSVPDAETKSGTITTAGTILTGKNTFFALEVHTITLTGTSGTAKININGTGYLATFDTDIPTTVSGFITLHKDNIRNNARVIVTGSGPGNSIILTEGSIKFASLFSNVSGDLSGTIVVNKAEIEQGDLIYSFHRSEIREVAAVKSNTEIELVNKFQPNVLEIEPVFFNGTGLDDATSNSGNGVWGGTKDSVFTIEISVAGGTDSFKWKKDSGAFSGDIAITGAAQALSDGVTITFAATTGHTLTDQWTIDAGEQLKIVKKGVFRLIGISNTGSNNGKINGKECVPGTNFNWEAEGGLNPVSFDATNTEFQITTLT